MLFKHLVKGICAGGMYILYCAVGSLGLLAGALKHFMCNGLCKHNYHFGRAYLILKICRALSKNLAFTAVLFAYSLIFAVHAIVPAHYNYVQWGFTSPLNCLNFFFTLNSARKITALFPSAIIIWAKFVSIFSPPLYLWD